MAIDTIGNLQSAVYQQPPRDYPAVRSENSSKSPSAPVKTQTESAIKEAEQSAKPSKSPNKDELNEALKKMNDFVKNNDILFTVDEETDIRVVKVVDRATKDIIRQFPSEDMIHLAKALDQLQGLLIRQKA